MEREFSNTTERVKKLYFLSYLRLLQIMNNSFFFHLMLKIFHFSLFFLHFVVIFRFNYLLNPPHRFPHLFNLQIMIFDFFFRKILLKIWCRVQFCSQTTSCNPPFDSFEKWQRREQIKTRLNQFLLEVYFNLIFNLF